MQAEVVDEAMNQPTPVQTTTQIGGQTIVVTEDKPEVAPVETNNQPNRVVVSIMEDPATEMGFSWYTSDKLSDSQVAISKSKDLDSPLIFEATTRPVISYYGERDAEGHFIFEEDVNKDQLIDGYFTDQQIHSNNTEWTGNARSNIQLQPTLEFVHQVVATGLEPDTTYFYSLGSPSTFMTPLASFKTAGNAQDSFSFLRYSDSQVGY